TVKSVGSDLDGSFSSTTTTVTNFLVPDLTNWLVGLAYGNSVTRKQSSDAQGVTRSTTFNYDAAGRLKTETIEPNDTTPTFSLKYTTTYDYHPTFGVQTQKTEAWQDPYSSSIFSRILTSTGLAKPPSSAS